MLQGTDMAVKLMKAHSWCATASPALPSERSESGTVGGVLAAVKKIVREQGAEYLHRFRRAVDSDRVCSQEGSSSCNMLKSFASQGIC